MHPYLEHLLSIWREELRGPRRRLVLAAWFLALFGGAHVARLGTPGYRAATFTAILLVLAGWIVSTWRQRRIEHDSRRALRTLVTGARRVEGEKAARALSLVEATKRDPSVGSPELAELHWTRSLRAIAPDHVRESALRRARVISALAMVAAVGVLVSVASGPSRVVEGLDVLVTHGRVAPLNLDFVDALEVQVHPPEYLKQKGFAQRGLSSLDAPYGSLLTVRGTPLRGGRQLVLTDGETEVSFVDDGSGGVTARWPLHQSTALKIGARFGDVRIEQEETLALVSIADAAPQVDLEGAPRVVKLLDEPEIPILYRATDDHGLTQVDLVLRSGTREERRVLSKLEQEVVRDQGGMMLRANDRFLQGVFLPVEVTVQARDNDPLTGPKWGVSAAISLMPPILGEPEALRYEALLTIKNRLIDLLASQVTAVEPAAPSATSSKEFRELVEREQTTFRELSVDAARVLSEKQGSLAISRRTRALIDGQLRKIGDAFDKAAKTPGKTSRTTVKTALEDATLAIDSALMSLSTRDAQSVAKRLSKVADEAADGLKTARGVDNSDPPERGKERARIAMAVLEPSGKALRRLGILGEDLGSIVANDLRRISRSQNEGNLLHAELAARDLAGRLAKANPSFSGGTSSSGHGSGTESGGGAAPDPGDSSASDAEQAMEEGDRELGKLSRDHAESLEGVEQAMRDANDSEDGDAMREMASKHAEAVRDAVKKLPKNGGDPDSSQGASASAREQAERMAEALERGSASDAVEAGKAAMKRLAEAERLAKRDEMIGDPAGQAAKDAAGKVAAELKWTEELLDHVRKRAQERAHLDGAADKEKGIADRTKDLSDKSRNGNAPAPGKTGEYMDGAEAKMREAVRSLKSGDVTKALEQQREAQKLLEMAKQEGQEPEGKDDGRDDAREASQRESGDGKKPSLGPEVIPKPDEHKGPEMFRQRVLDGLSRSGSPRLRGAVQRYTERLLK